MDNDTAQLMIDAVNGFRVAMVNDFCMGDNQVEAVVQLSSQFVTQAAVCLGAVYGDNKSIIQKHLILLIVRSLGDEEVTV